MSILGFSLSMNTNSASKAQYEDKTVEVLQYDKSDFNIY